MKFFRKEFHPLFSAFRVSVKIFQSACTNNEITVSLCKIWTSTFTIGFCRKWVLCEYRSIPLSKSNGNFQNLVNLNSMVQPIEYETTIVDCSELKLHISDGGRKCTRLCYRYLYRANTGERKWMETLIILLGNTIMYNRKYKKLVYYNENCK